MGKIVSVWSPAKKNGKTVFIYMLTRHLAEFVSKDCKILVVCTNLGYGNLMELFNVGRDEMNFEDVVNFKLHPGSELNLLNALARQDNVYFLGSKKTGKNYANRHLQIFEGLLEEFRSCFDLVLIDTISGSDNALTNMMLDKSDCVINVINQDKESLDRQPFTTGKEIACIVNGYRDIYPAVRDLILLYNLKDIFTLPFCDDLQEMKNRGKLDLYVHHDTEYNRAVKGVAEVVADRLGMEVKGQVAREEKRPRGLIGSLISGLSGN